MRAKEVKVTLTFDVVSKRGEKPRLELRNDKRCIERICTNGVGRCAYYGHSWYCDHVCRELGRILGEHYVLANADSLL